MKLTKLITKTEIEVIVTRLASDINQHYVGKDLTVIVVLNGAFIFAADLVRQLTMPITAEFVRASSYGGDTTSSGKVEVIVDKGTISVVKGRDVLIVDDILDTGLTLQAVTEELVKMGPLSIEACVPFVKGNLGKWANLIARFRGVSIPTVFVVGYGLDYKGTMRNLPELYYVNEEVRE